MSISFSVYCWLIDDREPELKDFEEIFINKNRDEEVISLVGYSCKVVSERIDDNIFFLYMNYGKGEPYSEQVYNSKKESTEKNPKSKEQIEFREQLFVFYAENEQLLFISNATKRGFLSKCFEKKTKKNHEIRPLYGDIPTFEAAIKELNSVEFIHFRSLFSRAEDPLQVIEREADTLGFDTETELKITARLKTRWDFKNILKSFTANKENFKYLVMTGTAEDGAKMKLDMSALIRKIDIEVMKNDQGFFNKNDVKARFILKLKESNL